MSGFYLIFVISMVLGFAVQGYVSSNYNRYARVSNGLNMTGAQIARRMLDDNGLYNVQVQAVAGTLTDHYDPRTRTVRLSEGVYSQPSVSAMAIACHECGHAVQHARSYVPMNIRTALVPVANIGSSAWLILLIVGISMYNAGSMFGWNLIQVALILYGFAVLFHLVTLPVEFNASHRGLAYIRGNSDPGLVVASTALALPGNAAADGAQKVLTAAALTYVVSALTSIMQLFYFMNLLRR